MLEHEPGIRGERRLADRAAERAARLAPQRLDHPRVVRARVRVGHGPALLAATGRVAAREAHAQWIAELRLEGAAPVVAGAGAERHLRVDLDAGQRRLRRHGGHAACRVGREGVEHRLVVEHQCVGSHVVRARGIAVEIARIAVAGIEGAAIEQDVAVDVAHPDLTQVAQQQPDLLKHQLRVAAAADRHRAIQHAGLQPAAEVHRRRPLPGRAELIERCVGGEQLEHRGRVDPLLLVERQRPGRSVQGGDHGRQGAHRNAGVLQRRTHFGRQIGGMGQGQTRSQHTPDEQMAQRVAQRVAAGGRRGGETGRAGHAQMIARLHLPHARSQGRLLARARRFTPA